MTACTAHQMPTSGTQRRAGRQRLAHTLLAWLGVVLSPVWVVGAFLITSLLAAGLGLHASGDGTYPALENAAMTLMATGVVGTGLTFAVVHGLRAGRAGSAWGIAAAVTAGILLAFLLVGAVTSLMFG